MEERKIKHLLSQSLSWEGAHASFDTAIKDIPFSILGKNHPNVPYTIWQLTEHIRITQADILDFCINQNYKELEWPKDYWPKEPMPKESGQWEKTIKQVREDRLSLLSLIDNTDLTTPIPHGTGQNLFREILLVIDHTAYHTGQIILLRRLMGNWEGR